MTQHFKQLQHNFADWLREPQSSAEFAGIEPRRLAVYRRLVHNNIRQFLHSGFPVLQQVLSSEQWQRLMAGFVAEHQAHSPLFSSIGQEFVDYLATLDLSQAELPEWTFELAHYERLEVAVQFATLNQVSTATQPLGDATRVVLNETAQMACYHYPVAEIKVGNLPTAPAPTAYCVVVYQAPSGQVHFLQLNPMTAFVLELLQQQPYSLTELCDTLMAQLPGYTEAQLKSALSQLLEDFAARSVLFTTP